MTHEGIIQDLERSSERIGSIDEQLQELYQQRRQLENEKSKILQETSKVYNKVRQDVLKGEFTLGSQIDDFAFINYVSAREGRAGLSLDTERMEKCRSVIELLNEQLPNSIGQEVLIVDRNPIHDQLIGEAFRLGIVTGDKVQVNEPAGFCGIPTDGFVVDTSDARMAHFLKRQGVILLEDPATIGEESDFDICRQNTIVTEIFFGEEAILEFLNRPTNTQVPNSFNRIGNFAKMRKAFSGEVLPEDNYSELNYL